MDELTNLAQWVVDIGGFNLVFNADTLINSWIVMGIVIAFGVASTRKLSFLPGNFQTVAELMVGAFEGLVNDALDEGNRHYLPLIITLFLFIWVSNVLGIIPHLSEPTRDLNTTLAYGFMGFCIAHYAGIKTKGLGPYLRTYTEPMFFMAPLNIIGELSKVVSISFRLYGNIMGGAIIIMVVSDMVYNVLLPPFLNAFFGLFVGTIQAFVFTMLTLVYISVQTK